MQKQRRPYDWEREWPGLREAPVRPTSGIWVNKPEWLERRSVELGIEFVDLMTESFGRGACDGVRFQLREIAAHEQYED